MTSFKTYALKYPNIRFEREGAVLQMALHSEGGPLLWGALEGSIHGQLADAFDDVARDRDNAVLIITGTGDAFCTGFDWEDTIPADGASPAYWDRIYQEGKDMIQNLLDLPMPVIGAVNGPALVHAELVAMSDIVLAAEGAVFADKAHMTVDAVPGDGVHVFWPMVLGINRGREFLLTGREIGVEEAKAIGLVAEVMPLDSLMPRAREIAETLAAKPRMVLRYARTALTRELKRRMTDDLGYALMAEGMAVLARDWKRDEGS